MSVDRFVIKGKPRAGTIRAQVDRIIVGSGSACTLTVDDPLVAEAHCSFATTPYGFEIEDCGSTSGTYLNGLRVKDKHDVVTGDEVVLGLSRLELDVDAEAHQLTLTLKEKGFHFDKHRDTLLWSRKEVTFGRFRWLRYANWVAIGLLVALFIACLIPRSGDALLEPGPLASAHQEACLLAEDAAGCESCHEPGGLLGSYGTVPTDKCGSCHEEILTSTHPFNQWKGLDSEERGCVDCHRDHRGAEMRSIVAIAASDTCGDCHEADRELEKHLTDGAAVPRREVHVLYDGFSHADHVAAEGIPCSRCHVRSAEPLAATATQPEREFGRVDQAACMACHGADAKPEDRAEAIYEVAWHGADSDGERCLACHQELYQDRLRESQSVSAEKRLFAFLSRSHHEQLVAHEGQPVDDGDCRACHRRGEVGGGRQLSSAFRHGTHMSHLFPEASAGRKERSEECAACHVELSDASGLTSGIYKGPGEGSCERCHREKNGSPAAPTFVAGATGGETTRIDFPHAVHVSSSHPKLADGCFTCHEFGQGPAWDAQPATHATAKTCKPCHEAHDSMGGGDCDACHPKGDAVFRNEPIVRSWPINANFSHFTRGHAAMTDSGNEGCLECHEGADRATTISSMPIPQESERLCRDCHVGQKARFHWK